MFNGSYLKIEFEKYITEFSNTNVSLKINFKLERDNYDISKINEDWYRNYSSENVLLFNIFYVLRIITWNKTS